MNDWGEGVNFVTMTTKRLAEILDGREYMNEITPDEEDTAWRNGLVVVYGFSDDNIEFAGAIDDEIGAYCGRTVYVTPDDVYTDDTHGGTAITAVWCKEGFDFAWMFETDIPHETFRILEDGEHYCMGIVFSVKDLEAMT